MHACMDGWMYVCMYVCKCMYGYACIHTYNYLGVSISLYIYMHTATLWLVAIHVVPGQPSSVLMPGPKKLFERSACSLRCAAEGFNFAGAGSSWLR